MSIFNFILIATSAVVLPIFVWNEEYELAFGGMVDILAFLSVFLGSKKVEFEREVKLYYYLNIILSSLTLLTSLLLYRSNCYVAAQVLLITSAASKFHFPVLHHGMIYVIQSCKSWASVMVSVVCPSLWMILILKVDYLDNHIMLLVAVFGWLYAGVAQLVQVNMKKLLPYIVISYRCAAVALMCLGYNYLTYVLLIALHGAVLLSFLKEGSFFDSIFDYLPRLKCRSLSCSFVMYLFVLLPSIIFSLLLVNDSLPLWFQCISLFVLLLTSTRLSLLVLARPISIPGR